VGTVQMMQGVKWNWDVGEVSYPGRKPVQLTRQQSDILEILWRRYPGPASKEVILSQLYGRIAEPEAADAIVKVQAGHIRRKFRSAGLPVEIEGVRSVGYILRFADGEIANGNIGNINAP
jgi:DNA-binding response OmpR family regulator